MQSFTIKDIENLSGIKAHTLRIWEKRYGIIAPKRKDSNQRFYDNEDLKQVLRITNLYRKGHKISAIARMKERGVLESNKMDLESAYENNFIEILLGAAFDFNQTLFDSTLKNSIEILGIEKCMLEVVYPYFEKVGLLWINNRSLPVQERFASNYIRKRIVIAIDGLPKTSPRVMQNIILFTPQFEYHEIPLLFMDYMLKKRLQRVIYLGTNVNLETLEEFTASQNVGKIYFHSITNFTKVDINEYINKLSRKFYTKEIIMSGPLTKQIKSNNKNVRLLTSLKEMIHFGMDNT